MLIVILYFLSITSGQETHDDDVYPLALLGVRYIVQMIRGIITIRANQEIQQASMIDFDLSKEQQPSQEGRTRKISLVVMKSEP